MIALLLPIALVAAVVMLGRSGDAAPAVSGAAPSPILVFNAFLRAGKRPPPFVVQCAIAEAKTIGKYDLACSIMETFGAGGGVESAAALTSTPASPPVVPRAKALQTTVRAMSDEELTRAAVQAQNAERAQEPEQAVPQQRDTEVASPIPGVSGAQWSEFAGRLVRETPTFDGPRHVGRYRMNKDRLAQIGFDPAELAGSVAAQDAAFGADVADAFHHADQSGMRSHYVGAAVEIPDLDEPQTVTLSGVLGVAAVAGLEGAVEWLEQPTDRKRYPHTTAAFMRTNGVF